MVGRRGVGLNRCGSSERRGVCLGVCRGMPATIQSVIARRVTTTGVAKVSVLCCPRHSGERVSQMQLLFAAESVACRCKGLIDFGDLFRFPLPREL